MPSLAENPKGGASIPPVAWVSCASIAAFAWAVLCSAANRGWPLSSPVLTDQCIIMPIAIALLRPSCGCARGSRFERPRSCAQITAEWLLATFEIVFQIVAEMADCQENQCQWKAFSAVRHRFVPSILLTGARHRGTLVFQIPISAGGLASKRHPHFGRLCQ